MNIKNNALIVKNLVTNKSGELRIDCPNCKGSQKETLSVNADSGVYNCYRCGFKGNFNQYQKQDKSENKAEWIWDNALPCESHSYLTEKGVKSYGLRLYKGSLVIPYHKITGELSTLQFINEKKYFLSNKNGNNPKKSSFFTIGNKDSEIFYICEGYATGASVYEACGKCIIVCGDAGNLFPASTVIRKKYPDKKLVFCADNDRDKTDNSYDIGFKKASEAAAAVNGYIIMPEITGYDFNDLHIKQNLDAVKNRIGQAELIKSEYLKTVTEICKTELSSKEILDCLYANEDGDSKLFIRLFKNKLIYDHAENQWYIWNNHYWKFDGIDSVYAYISGVIDIYATEAESQAKQRINTQKEGDTEKAKKHEKHYDALIKRIGALRYVGRKKSVLYGASRLENSLAIEGTEWDKIPFILPCKNGVINLKTGKLEKGKPSDFIRTYIPHEFNEKAECPNWHKFLYEIFDNDFQLVDFIQRLFGYAIAGKVKHHIFPVFYGEGRNGKGTLLETLKYVLGNFAHKTNSDTLMEQKRGSQKSQHDADTHALWGKRLIYASETEQGRGFNMSKVKELVGGDTLNARLPFSRRPTEFTPSFLLILMTNNKPRVKGTDFAFWERLFLIPFTLAFVNREPKNKNERKADIHLDDKLKAETQGILNWLVEGCLKWQKEGLNPPDSVKFATQEYKKEEDIIGLFISECCEETPGAEIKLSDLHSEYKIWSESRGEFSMSIKRFGNEIRKKYDTYTKRHSFVLNIQIVKKV